MTGVTVDQLYELDAGLIGDAIKLRFYPMAVERGQGSRLWDVEGKKYLDFTAGWAVANTGYSHPRVKQAVIEQLNHTTFAGLISVMHEPALELAEKLVELVPGDFRKKTWFGLSGSDASETVGRLLPMPEGAAIEWREGDAQALPLPDKVFNLALCSAGLQFFPDRLAAVREMFRVLQPGGRLGVCVARSLDLNPASHLLWGSFARHLKTTPEKLTPAWSLGNAEVFRNLIEPGGFADVALFSCSGIVREPRNPQLIAVMLASLPSNVVPAFATMGREERNSLAHAVEREIGPGLQRYAEGDEQLYPMSFQVAMAYKH
jgi:4-aminobutyrate aminotransferase